LHSGQGGHIASPFHNHTSTAMCPLTFDAVRSAHERIAPYVHRTPVLTSKALDRAADARLFFKAENFQKTGAFKARGATNAVLELPASTQGVVTHSSGNHGAALARAAALRGLVAHIVMPQNAPTAKQAAVRGYGGLIAICEPTLAAREATAAEIIAATGAVLIHPYNDLAVMAGQGTASLELLQDVPELDLLVVPVGGGGLLSGTAVAAKGVRPGVRVVGAEPSGADDAFRSFHSGVLMPPPAAQTIADGLRGALGEHTFAVIRSQVDDIVTVSENEIIAALRLVWERMKIIIEPSAAVPVAAVLSGRIAFTADTRIGIILSGGNVDLDSLPWATV
jgi:threonine dehydratase